MRFKVGDKVKVIGNTSNHYFKIDELLSIRKIINDSKQQYYYATNGNESWHIYDKDLSSTVANLRVGDRVKFITSTKVDRRYKLGDTGTIITEVSATGIVMVQWDNFYTCYDGSKSFKADCYATDLEVIPPKAISIDEPTTTEPMLKVCDEVLIDDSLGTNVVLFITGRGCLLEMADGEHAFYEFNRIYIKYVANK